MNTLRVVATKRGVFHVCQEAPGYGLVWVRYIGEREIERSGGAFYSDMGDGWHRDALVACVQGIRRKCAKVRHLLRGE